MQRQRLAEKKSVEEKRIEVKRLTCELEQAIERLMNELECRKIRKVGQGVDLQSVKDEEEEGYQVEKDDMILGCKLWEGDGTTAILLKQRYLSLVLQQGAMTEVNRRLSERFEKWKKFMKLLGIEHERLVEDTIESDNRWVHEGEEGHWVVFSQEEPVIFYQPIARHTCHELAFRAYQRMQEVKHGPGARTLYNEAFGWKVCFSMHEVDETNVHKTRMQHRSTKRISAVDAGGKHITGDTLAAMTWKIISTPELYTQMYRRPMTSKILQQVQDCVIDQTSGMMGVKSSIRRRVTILTSILDPSKCVPYASTHMMTSKVEWMREGMSYLSFTEIDDDDSVEIEYGGLMNVGSETASCTGLPFVAMNIGEALVRWEQLVTSMRILSMTGGN
ncbi:unnamed protein product [Peronospora belbahrii]|uniref:Uncharacterized protein n=1 Tax=Peronospora belbahrii TaxID=622444 RepID=A0AAU9KY67_9STRA|nr:unnamed protein product [Peronospora belbahrii]